MPVGEQVEQCEDTVTTGRHVPDPLFKPFVNSIAPGPENRHRQTFLGMKITVNSQFRCGCPVDDLLYSYRMHSALVNS